MVKIKCKVCGCQVVAQERKRNYVPYIPSDDEEEEEIENGRSDE